MFLRVGIFKGLAYGSKKECIRLSFVNKQNSCIFKSRQVRVKIAKSQANHTLNLGGMTPRLSFGLMDRDTGSNPGYF